MLVSKSKRKIFAELSKQGWTFRLGKKHGKLISPQGHRVIYSKTPSDRNAIHNLKRDINNIQRLENKQ